MFRHELLRSAGIWRGGGGKWELVSIIMRAVLSNSELGFGRRWRGFDQQCVGLCSNMGWCRQISGRLGHLEQL